MPTVLSDRCPKCGEIISYTSEETTELRCPYCDHSFLVMEFVSERLKMEQTQAERAKAQADLAEAEAEKKALQARLNGTLTALKTIESTQRAEDVKLGSLLNSLNADRKTHEAMTELLRTIQQGQHSGQDALSQLLRAVMKEQTDASGKLSAVQELSAQILRAQKSGAEAVVQMQDEILERIDKFDMKARDRINLSNDFCAWSKSMQQADVQRLQKLQTSSDALLQEQKAMAAKLNDLSEAITRTENAVVKGFDEQRRQHLDTLIELYHQATGLQLERRFDEAEATYRELLAQGGKDAQDAEIYWRMLLCHYGVEYQDENGKTIPIILRPDLTDPAKMQVRKDLREHIKNEQQKSHYAERLKKIDFYLQRYREVRLDPAWEFDVFISVKQNDNGRFTQDSDAASELYNYFIQDSALAAKKLRVFNSRYTHLPVGEVFEPYIITALMSAKVLIVVGSTPEYMNSQWVKNEWSRFQYLQDRERKQGKTDRRLFCYLTGGMQPKNLPVALNPEKQVITEGPTTGIILREIMDRAFPDKAVMNTVPKDSVETPEMIVNKMRAWLKLGLYQKVIDQYEGLLDTRPEILTNEPWLCLYTLCAKTRFQTIELLATAETDLRVDPLYKIAYEGADALLRAQLDALWEKKTEALNPRLMGITTISAGDRHTVGVKENGTVVAVGWNSFGQCDVSGWRNIVAVSVGYIHTVGLKEDGTVVAVGYYLDGECNVSGWKDIVAVSAGVYHTVGLKEDGTVVAVGRNVEGQCNVFDWKNIVAVSAAGHYTVGLKEDGTVVAVGENDRGQCNVSGWKNIVAVSAGTDYTVGLKKDGTMVAVGYNNYGQCNVSDWKNIVAISAGSVHTVGLKEDGTVVAVGKKGYGRCNVSDWKNIVAVSAGDRHTVGLKNDGTIVAAISWLSEQSDVSDWTDIRVP